MPKACASIRSGAGQESASVPTIPALQRRSSRGEGVVAQRQARERVMFINTEKKGGREGYLRTGGLRGENLRLRGLLERAQAIATRYAIMLREGDHRIKNSLQIVSSLMKLQADREENFSVRDALRTATARIQSVARMHDALQASGGEDSLNLGEVLEKMCGSLHAMGGEALAVTVRVDAEAVQVPAATAQPIVLAVNELVVNALRHAFPDGRTGSIIIRLRCRGDQLRVLVSDDGIGLPSVQAGYSEGHGYGMKLVRMMTKQIDGVLYVDSGAGTRITIVAPAPEAVVVQVKAAPAGSSYSAPVQSERVGRPARNPVRLPWRASGRG